MDNELNYFYEHLNSAVVTTNNFADGTKFRKRERVADYAYCGLNQMYKSYLSFDIDRRGSANYFEYVGLPAPTIITVNPENAHCHYLYRLKTPVAYHRSSRSAPQDYFESVQKEMELRLRADLAYNHRITKNPLHPRWRVQTYTASYHLSDFLEYGIELPKQRTDRMRQSDSLACGRNDRLFYMLRIWAYKAVNQSDDIATFATRVEVEASDINSHFDCPLPASEIKNTVKSITSWVWKHQNDIRQNREKVLEIEGGKPQERMSKGAAYTNEVRREKSLSILRTAVLEITASSNEQINISLLARYTGLNIKTVRKYFSAL